jgi:hypothetical protein
MCIAGQWQKNQAYIRSLFRFGRRLSFRQRRSLESIEHELVANDPSLAGMFAEFGEPPTPPPWATGGPRSPWEHQ